MKLWTGQKREGEIVLMRRNTCSKGQEQQKKERENREWTQREGERRETRNEKTEEKSSHLDDMGGGEGEIQRRRKTENMKRVKVMREKKHDGGKKWKNICVLY